MVKCKNCRAALPLLKTRWLCKKDRKRVLLTMTPKPDNTGVVFGIQNVVPVQGGNTAQRRAHDKRVGDGTMSRAGAKCPCCGTIMTMVDIRSEGKAGRLGTMPTAVVTEGRTTKTYRLPTEHEIDCAGRAEAEVEKVFSDIPFGLPTEPTPAGGGRGAARAFSIQGYGLTKWKDLFTSRQIHCLGVLLEITRNTLIELNKYHFEKKIWLEAIYCGLVVGIDRIADRQSTICRWDNGYSKLQGTFTRFALPIT